MTNITQEVLAAPRLTRVQYQPVATSNHFFINTLLLVVSIPAAIITIAILLAMIPFRIPEMFTR